MRFSAFREAPVIDCPVATLRPHRLEDFEAYAAMWADPEVTRFIGGRPRSREESWIRFLRHAGMWSLLGCGFWAVEDRASGAFVGEAGFHDLKRDMSASIEGEPEAGWALVPAAQGRGLATEIVRCMLAWGDRTFGAARTVCIIEPEHVRSIAVARKCGFSEVLRTTYHERATILFERWPAPRAEPERFKPV